ncbi:MAG: hypothetical protein AYK18_17185 [Theionarchaea archaeon DG-70]|nr:MAG: hypothetical protein AYK18_17185 [Theionarchaea archaeon DG-70]
MSSKNEQLKHPDVILQVTPWGLYITSFAETKEEEEKQVLQIIAEMEKLGISCKFLERGWCA